MSVIFGLFYKDGKPVSDELEAMYAGMRHIPHEQHAFAVRGNCGFGHMLRYNTPEAVRESMPKWVEDARILFVAEGRLDNRAELLDALDIAAAARGDMPDGDIMLAAYLRWGEDCVHRMLGKFSLAAFHTEENRLFLARDKWDYTNVEYFSDGGAFAFASYTKGLFPLPFIPKKIDEIILTRVLIVWSGDFDRSVYQGIRYLLPAHCLRVTREEDRLRRYWNYADIRIRRGLKLDDYAGDLFDNLNKAVAARLRSYRPVAATLSGGMDSSSVCSLAAEHLARRGERLRTYSHVPLYAPSKALVERQFGNERPYIEALVNMTNNIDPAFLDSAGITPLAGMRQAVRMCDRPFHGAVNEYWFIDICQTAVREGYGTILLGEFGNATISWPGMQDKLPAAEILRRYGAVGLIKKKILKPILYVRSPVGFLFRRAMFGSRPWEKISYCTRAFQDSIRLPKRIRKSGFDPTYLFYFRNPKGHAMRIFDVNVLRLPFSAEFGYEFGLEFRDPTGDPRVIESALSIPNEMYFGEMDKWILRTMMKGRLPDMVRLNVKKGKQSSDIAARLYAQRDEMDRLFDEMAVSDFHRIVDVERLRAQWETLKADPALYPPNDIAHMLRHLSAFELYRQPAPAEETKKFLPEDLKSAHK